MFTKEIYSANYVRLRNVTCRFAILNECWYLAPEGILDVADIDAVMSHGLGPRYAFMGPLETAHMNKPVGDGQIFQIFVYL